MKLTKHVTTFTAVACLLLATGCSKDDNVEVAGPSLQFTEVGSNNSKIANPGYDLHLEGSIEAPATIKELKIQITPKVSGLGWTYAKTYSTGYAGNKNAELHEHMDVPADARPGAYEIVATVTDMAGKRAEAKSDLTIAKDANLPSATNFSVSLSSTAQLRVAGNINTPAKIAKVVVEVQSATWTRSYEFTDAALVGQTTYAFLQIIDIAAAPSGHYHINMTIYDQAGKKVTYSDHLNK